MLSLTSTSSRAAAFFVLAICARRAYAVCAPGAIGIGRESVRFTDIIGTQVVYEGIAVTNDCGVFGKTDVTQDSNQVCSGEWNAALAVSCSGGIPSTVVTQGRNTLTCTPTTDTSCNVNTGGDDPVIFEVVACCA